MLFTYYYLNSNTDILLSTCVATSTVVSLDLKDYYKNQPFVKQCLKVKISPALFSPSGHRTLNFTASWRTCFSYPERFLHIFSRIRTKSAYKSSKSAYEIFPLILGIDENAFSRERDRQSKNQRHQRTQRQIPPDNLCQQKLRWRTWRPLATKPEIRR